MPGNILFVDNDKDFLSTRSEFLTRSGYTILKASSLAEATQILNSKHVHVIIVDIRMQNDDDERDISGLYLLDEPACYLIPAIVLTGYPSADIAVQVLKPNFDGKSPAVNFVKKEDGPSALINAVEQALIHPSFCINWNLSIDWKSRDAFSFVRLIENVQSELFLSRAEEFEDLFRRLFYGKDHIRIERMLWCKDRRIALIVFAFKGGMQSEAHVVICGQNKVINEEAKRFKEFAPKIPGETGVVLDERMRSETTHYAANAYTLANNDLESIQTILDLYHTGPERVFNTALNNLYHGVLSAWHQGKLISEVTRNFEGSYQERLRLSHVLGQENFEERVNAIKSQIPRLKATIERMDGKFTFHFTTSTYEYPDPIPLMFQLIETGGPLITVPGTLSGENVIVNLSGRTWLTDFAEAGQATRFWNFVNLEANIRFDWVDTNNLLHLHQMEQSLVNNDFIKPDLKDLEPSVRKPVSAIVAIRKLASREIGKNTHEYHNGVFFHAVRRLFDFDPNHLLTSNELARLGHLLFSMTIIAKKLLEDRKDDSPFSPVEMDKIVGVDEKSRKVLIGKREIRLAPQRFEVFMYLYRNANGVCTKKELLEIALKGEFDEQYLPTLIKRIREEIENDPKHPRFLITEPNTGYKLILDPK